MKKASAKKKVSAKFDDKKRVILLVNE